MHSRFHLFLGIGQYATTARIFHATSNTLMHHYHTVRFLTDGGDYVRAVPEFLSAESEHCVVP